MEANLYFFLMFNLVDCCHHHFRSSTFSSSSHLPLFLKSTRSCVFISFFLLSLLLSVLQCHHEKGNLFLGHVQSNWFFCTGHCLETIFHLLRSPSTSLITFLIFSFLLQHHSSKLSKYFRSSFLSVQVFELNNPML